VFVLASLVVVAVGRVASSSIDASRAQVAAEAMAHAAALSADLSAIALSHGVSSYEVVRDGSSVTVVVVRRGHKSSASASDHRRTLELGQ
jgi:hypothetical protein